MSTTKKKGDARTKPTQSVAAKSTKKAAVSAAEFNSVLAGMELKAIAVNGCNCYVKNRRKIQNEPSNFKPELQSGTAYDNFSLPNGTTLVIVIFEIQLCLQEEGDEEPALEISFALQLDFISKTGAISDEFFDQFAEGPLLLVAFPFAREFAQNMTMRMGVPPVVFPLIKVGPDGDEEIDGIWKTGE